MTKAWHREVRELAQCHTEQGFGLRDCGSIAPLHSVDALSLSKACIPAPSQPPHPPRPSQPYSIPGLWGSISSPPAPCRAPGTLGLHTCLSSQIPRALWASLLGGPSLSKLCFCCPSLSPLPPLLPGVVGAAGIITCSLKSLVLGLDLGFWHRSPELKSLLSLLSCHPLPEALTTGVP